MQQKVLSEKQNSLSNIRSVAKTPEIAIQTEQVQSSKSTSKIMKIFKNRKKDIFEVKQRLIQSEMELVLNNNVKEPKQQRNRKTEVGNNASKSILH